MLEELGASFDSGASHFHLAHLSRGSELWWSVPFSRCCAIQISFIMNASDWEHCHRVGCYNYNTTPKNTLSQQSILYIAPDNGNKYQNIGTVEVLLKYSILLLSTLKLKQRKNVVAGWNDDWKAPLLCHSFTFEVSSLPHLYILNINIERLKTTYTAYFLRDKRSSLESERVT